MLKHINLLMLIIIISGCMNDEVEKSKEFYLNNNQDREEKLKECKDDFYNQLKENCFHARNAESQISHNKIMNNGIKVDYSSSEKK